MDETSDEPVMVWQFLRRYFVQIVIGAVLVVAVYGALLVWVPYQREQRIAKEFEALGGRVKFQYAGPDWIPQSIRDRTTLFHRVTDLHLFNTQVTDASLEHLKELTNLEWLDLNYTKVTDAGLEQVIGLTKLEEIFLRYTQVTAEGRAMLRKALPRCEIDPQ